MTFISPVSSRLTFILNLVSLRPFFEWVTFISSWSVRVARGSGFQSHPVHASRDRIYRQGSERLGNWLIPNKNFSLEYTLAQLRLYYLSRAPRTRFSGVSVVWLAVSLESGVAYIALRPSFSRSDGWHPPTSFASGDGKLGCICKVCYVSIPSWVAHQPTTSGFHHYPYTGNQHIYLVIYFIIMHYYYCLQYLAYVRTIFIIRVISIYR